MQQSSKIIIADKFSNSRSPEIPQSRQLSNNLWIFPQQLGISAAIFLVLWPVTSDPWPGWLIFPRGGKLGRKTTRALFWISSLKFNYAIISSCTMNSLLGSALLWQLFVFHLSVCKTNNWRVEISLKFILVARITCKADLDFPPNSQDKQVAYLPEIRYPYSNKILSITIASGYTYSWIFTVIATRK